MFFSGKPECFLSKIVFCKFKLMKRLLFTLGLSLFLLNCFGQQDSLHALTAKDTSLVPGNATLLMLDSSVGYIISQQEKIAYDLFPYMPYQDFHTAEFFRLPDKSIVLVIQKSDSTTRIVNYTLTDYNSSAYLVRYYSGKIRPADDLNPSAAEYIIRGSIDMLEIFIRSKSNCK